MSAGHVILQCQSCIDVTQGVEKMQGMCACRKIPQTCTSTQKSTLLELYSHLNYKQALFEAIFGHRGLIPLLIGYTRGTCVARYVCVSANPAILYFNTEVHSSLKTWSTISFGPDYDC